MQSFRDFLIWFEGWSENIEDRPTLPQWERLREKLAQVKQGLAEAPPEPVHAEAAPRGKPPKPAVPTAKGWLEMVKTCLIDEEGLDPMSAQEMMEGLVVDTSRDPAAMAKSLMK